MVSKIWNNYLCPFFLCCGLSLFFLSGCQPERAKAKMPAKDQVIGQWQHAFAQLKSLKLSTKTYQISADEKKRLFTYGSFIYDAPLFLDDVTLAGSGQNANSKESYDGKYFYMYTSGKALAHLRPKDHPQSALLRAVKADGNRPSITVNPLYYLFGFALPEGDKTFGALSKPATWDNLKKRITDWKSEPGGGYIFHCRGQLQSDQSGTQYEVTVISKNGIYMPVRIKQSQPGQKLTTEMKVLAYSKSTFPLPVPLKLFAQSIVNNVPRGQFVTVVDAKDLQINPPIDQQIFTLHPKNPAELIDVKILR